MKKTLLAVTVASLFPSVAMAQMANETVVVTANRFDTQVSDTLAPIEVVTRQEIDEIQAHSLSEVLRRLPGVQIANQGGLGQNSELYMRGRSTKNLLVLLNGVRIGSATTGAANLAAIPLNGVERIEVLRGPRAAVYGADAVGGVVNIITTQDKNGHSSVKAEVGSDGFYELNGSVSLSDSEHWLNVSATHQQEDGYNVQPHSSNPADVDDDGFKSQYLVLDAGMRVSPAFTLKANGYYQKHDVEFDNPWVGSDKTDSDLYSMAIIGEYQHDQWNSRLTLSTNQDKARTYGQGADASTIATNRYVASWDNQYVVNSNITMVSGAEWYRDKVDNTDAISQYTDRDRDNQALYAGAYFNQGKLSAEGNVRWDDDSAYGAYWTYQLGLGYQLTDMVRVVGTHGTAFKAPTFNDLYWPGFGNPNLDPEETESNELAFEGQYADVSWRIAGHYSESKNMISSVCDASFNCLPYNVNRARIQGVEVSSRFDTGPISHQISYDYLDSENKETGKQLARTARHSAKWNMTYYLDAWQFDLSYLYQGKRFDDAGNNTTLDPYSLVDLAASYHFNNGITLSGKVGNLFDKSYETAKDYKSPERNYYASVAYEF